jgi:DsbC/DsbD-like thiol-disulfide interchange protein
MKSASVAALALGICVLYGLDTLSGQVRSDSKVKMTVKASPVADGKQTLEIRLMIDDGWYIYANPVDSDLLSSSETTVRIRGVDAKQVKIDYPKGVEKSLDKISYRAYIGEVTIKATVQRGPTDVGPLRVSVDVNSCSLKEGRCLAQGTLEAKVD